MGIPSEPEPSSDAFKFVTVRDLQEFLRYIGYQRIYRPKEKDDKDAVNEDRYINAVRRFRDVKNNESNSDKEK